MAAAMRIRLKVCMVAQGWSWPEEGGDVRRLAEVFALLQISFILFEKDFSCQRKMVD
jgi:hypothetical protein